MFLWNWTPFRSLNVQIVPSGESVQLSARSGSTSVVVTLPSLMANRVSPRNMKRAMACDCPSVLECGSRVSGSLAATFRIFLRCARVAPTSSQADEWALVLTAVGIPNAVEPDAGGWAVLAAANDATRAHAALAAYDEERRVETPRVSTALEPYPWMSGVAFG